MPNIKGAAKRMRQAEKNRQRNITVRTRVKKSRSKMLAPPASADAAAETFRAYCSDLDKAAKKGVIRKNTAIRRKTRAAARLRQATTATAPVTEAAAPAAS